MKVEQDVSSYAEGGGIFLDNEIILKKYPKRVIKKLNDRFYGNNMISCLELGLGYGYATEIFDAECKFKRHTVLDGDSDIIKQYREKHCDTEIEIIETYFENFETDEKYDVIVMGFILEHVDDPIDILKKYRQFLKPNGVLYIAVPNSESLHRQVGYLAGLLENTKTLSDADIKYGHKRYYDIGLIKKHCEIGGYSVSNIEGIFLKPITTGQLISLNLKPEVIDAFYEVGINYPELCNALLVEALPNIK